MATNVYFQSGNTSGTANEQRLVEDLVIESLKIYGHDVHYMPRTLVNRDTNFDEDEILKSSFGLSGYPSWVLLEGDMETGEAQIVSVSSGTKSYNDLVEMVTNYTATQNITEQIDVILENLYHWRLGHMTDNDMLGVITSALNYEFEEEVVKSYGVSHSSRLYIIDQNGDIRVLWRGTEWTYASIYHDVQILL